MCQMIKHLIIFGLRLGQGEVSFLFVFDITKQINILEIQLNLI